MNNDELCGVVVPIVVPLLAGDEVDEPSFRQHIRHLAEAGVHGLFVGGSAGEGPLLTMREWRKMMETAYDEIGDELPLLGGVMDTSTRRVSERIAILAEIGYRYFVVTPTFYVKPNTPDEHLRLFGECKLASRGMEMIAYNIPAAVGSSISLDTFVELGRRGWIRYCKESSEALPFSVDLIAATQQVGLKVLMGSEIAIAIALQAGAVGMVPVCANVEPETFVSMYQASVAGDTGAMSRLQKRINFLRETLVLAGPCWLAGPKYAVSCLGIGSERMSSPLQPLTAAEKDRLNKRLGLSPV